jgi:hypothetical protein
MHFTLRLRSFFQTLRARSAWLGAVSGACMLWGASTAAWAQAATPPLMKVSSGGIVGVGVDPDDTAQGISFAKVAVAGPSASKDGPHLQFTNTGDKYPLFQVLPWTHDNIALNFDAYYDGTGWKSSVDSATASGVFSMQKYKSMLQFLFAPTPGAGKGSTVAWQTALTIDKDGCVRAGATQMGTCSSDERLKTNIAPLPSSLDAVARLRLVSFDYRRDQFPGLPDGHQTGVVAQELQQVMPDLVSTDAAGLLRVDYGRMDRRIQQAVVELARNNKAQQDQITALREELAALRAQVAQRPGSR